MKKTIALLVFFFTFILCFSQGTWTQKANFGGTGRWFATGFSIGSYGYMGTGINNTGAYQQDFWQYDPSSDTWTTKASMPVIVGRYASAVVVDKIYVISGFNEAYASNTNLNQVYNPANNAWTFGENVPTGVLNAAAGATAGVNAPERIYVIGGWTKKPNCNNINQVYAPESDTWTTGASMLTARARFGIAVVDDVLFAIGGVADAQLSIGGSVSATNMQYTPAQYTAPTSPSPAPSQEPIKPASTEPLQTGLLPEAWIIVAAVTAAVLGTGLLVYFRKRKR